eukprot:3959050-Amphidinium_carterae.1
MIGHRLLTQARKVSPSDGCVCATGAPSRATSCANTTLVKWAVRLARGQPSKVSAAMSGTTSLSTELNWEHLPEGGGVRSSGTREWRRLCSKSASWKPMQSNAGSIGIHRLLMAILSYDS